MSGSEFTLRVRQLFDAVADHLLDQLKSGEDATLNISAEETLFVRLNSNLVRQNTDVEQIGFALLLQSQGRTMEQCCTLSGQLQTDLATLDQLLARARAEALVLPADPNQVPIANNGSSDEEFTGALLAPRDVVSAVVRPATGLDLSGFYAGGTVIRGNRNSKGQRHWFATQSFFFDYSVYNGPKAAKGCYAGPKWDDAEWAANLARTHALLRLLERPTYSVPPGKYRAYLAPAAFAEFLSMMGWNALSASAWKQGRSPFKKLAEKEACLSPLLQVDENFGMGLTPRFNSLGEVSETCLTLIAQGELKTTLVSSRTAKEYGLAGNAADESEAPRALDVAPGALAEKDILAALGTGLYLSNLHYLNWSDPVSARVTGMTRYACFWVEKGEIVGPIGDLRWDESLYDALGANLLALTAFTEISPAVDTYFQRALGGSRTPGALIEGFAFTL